MSASLHLDLLNDDERFSSSPIRLRVMVPLMGFLLVIGTLFGWSFLAFQAHALSTQKTTVETDITGLKSAHAEILRLRQQEKEMAASLKQLAFYRSSQLKFGASLARLPEVVPANVQFTEMRVPTPPPFMPDPKTPNLGPTNTFESVSLRLAGKAGGDRPTDAVNGLLKALDNNPAFSNLIHHAEIPKGAFRQDTARGAVNRDTLLFEINCTCQPRRFQ
jgi:Tfp pilus assembly protein PilN